MATNPFNLMYGRIPTDSFVDRTYIVDNIFAVFGDDSPSTMAYAITGVRGSGKTVLLRNIVSKFSEKEDWVTVTLSFGSDLVTSLADKLFHAGTKYKLFLDWELTIHASIISLSIGKNKQRINNPEIMLEEMLEKFKSAGKRVLIAIDEVNNTKDIRYFANVYQAIIGEGYDVFLLMTGLENNIVSLFNSNAASFLSRTPKIKLGPLDMKEISLNYQKHLGVDEETAIELAKITKGYAFAYQVLGYYLFQNNGSPLEDILNKFDIYMRNNGYDVIINDLTSTERKVCLAIAESENVADIARNAGMSPQNVSKYRQQLIKKEILESIGYGKIDFTLPRFKEFVLYYKTYKQ